MPAFKFNGFQPTFFNGLRDTEGNQLGWISPGDVIEAPEAPAPLFAPVDAPEDASESPEPDAPEAYFPVSLMQGDAMPDPAPHSPVNPAAAAVVH